MVWKLPATRSVACKTAPFLHRDAFQTGALPGFKLQLTLTEIQFLLHIVQVDGQHAADSLLLRRRKVHSVSNALAGVGPSVPLLLLSKSDPPCWAPIWWGYSPLIHLHLRFGTISSGNVLYGVTGYSIPSPHRSG